MFTEKSIVLADALSALNKPDQPWEVAVEGDSLVARWKWMDATFFTLSQVSMEARNYTFTVTLYDNGKWREVDRTSDQSMSASTSGFKFSKSMFVGKKFQKSIEIGVGRNNQTGESGIIGFKFDTTMVKRPIRAYLTDCGWKKAGLFESIRLKMGWGAK